MFVGCGKKPCPKQLFPDIKKAKHVSCEYFIQDDGSMDINNSQKADRCIEKLANNQNFYEYQVDNYKEYKAKKEKEFNQ